MYTRGLVAGNNPGYKSPLVNSYSGLVAGNNPGYKSPCVNSWGGGGGGGRPPPPAPGTISLVYTDLKARRAFSELTTIMYIHVHTVAQ